jgi:2-haloalkanoic acid dehalogenase type II
MRLGDFKVLTFDCYGTLIDWESGIIEALKPLCTRLHKPLSRDAILAAHARHESAQQEQTPSMRYRDLLAVVHKRLAEEWGVPVPWGECVAYGRSIGDWPAFADSAPALAYLKKFYKLAILSNVDNESFALSNKRLAVDFDAVYTAQDIGSYKPSIGNFRYMLDKLKTLRVKRSQILHTAESLFHDHAPANKMRLASCWIHRRHAEQGFGATTKPHKRPKCDFRFTSMSEMVAAHRAEGG